MPSDTDVAWAAGFFDGEGSVHIYNSPVSKRTGQRLPCCQVAICQSGDYADELLKRFASAVEMPGHLYGPRPPGKNSKKPVWQWEASGINNTQQVFDVLKPYLGPVKTAKFELVLKTCRDARS